MFTFLMISFGVVSHLVCLGLVLITLSTPR